LANEPEALNPVPVVPVLNAHVTSKSDCAVQSSSAVIPKAANTFPHPESKLSNVDGN